MTEKLYYLDSHLADFEAVVLACEETKTGFAVELDRTAFFPEGGGQPADTGVLGTVRVLDVHEKGGHILHFTDGPLPVGERIRGELDFEQRWRRMQNHSGEHIVSGLVHREYGYDNVGFHMGADCMTIDFSGELEWDALMEIETMANAVVRENLPVRAWFPEPETLADMSYRSKLELTENVRIVQIGQIDRCACCAPHVSQTGEIGLIKLLDSQRHRGGVRVTLVCGMDALEQVRAQQESVTQISQALSAKRAEVAPAVQRLLREQQEQKARCDALSMALVARLAAAESKTAGNLVLFDSLLDEVAQRELVNLLMEKAGGIAAVFCGDDESGWRYVVGSRHVDLRKAGRAVNAAIGGRGGGRPEMIMGRASFSRAEIEKGLAELHLE